jgi:hypothetical protein
MSEPNLRFPVTCPRCGKELLNELPVADVATALIQGNDINLHVSCHDFSWRATPLEEQQIREYLVALNDVEWAVVDSHSER